MPFILAAILLASVKLFERLILKSAYPKSMYSRVIYPMAFGTIVGGLLRSMLGC
jgi:hypothetical protein